MSRSPDKLRGKNKTTPRVPEHAAGRNTPEAVAPATKKARFIFFLMLAGLTFTGIAALVARNGTDNGKGKGAQKDADDGISAIYRKIEGAVEPKGPLTHAQMEEVFMELERMGLGKVYWKEPLGKRDETLPPSMTVALLHGDSSTWHPDVMRRSVLAGKHLRSAGFPVLGMEGEEKGKTLPHQQLEVNDKPMPWNILDKKLGLNPPVARQLAGQRLDIADILNHASPPGTWVGIEPPAILNKSRDRLPEKQKLDSYVQRFMNRTRTAKKGDSFNIEFVRNRNGGTAILIGGEEFDPAELKRWNDWHRDDYDGPEARQRNASFATETQPIFVGTGHLHAVQKEAAEKGRKAGFFLPHGAAIPADGINGDIRVATIDAVLTAYEKQEKGQQQQRK